MIASGLCYDSPTKGWKLTEAYRLFGETKKVSTEVQSPQLHDLIGARDSSVISEKKGILGN